MALEHTKPRLKIAIQPLISNQMKGRDRTTSKKLVTLRKSLRGEEGTSRPTSYLLQQMWCKTPRGKEAQRSSLNTPNSLRK
jgi:hypothetical protein